MSKIFSSPRSLALLIIIAAVFGLSVVGGALGAPFGLGFLGAPIATIVLPAEKVFSIGGYEVKNTAIELWISGVLLVLLAYFGTRKIRRGSPDADVPTGLQNFLEVIVEFFLNIAEQAGGRSARRFLPLVLAIFLVIVAANWISVLPGIGTIGRVETAGDLLAERTEVVHEAELAGETPEVENPDLVVFSEGGGIKLIPFGRTSQDNIPLGALSLAEDEHTVVLDSSRLDEDFSDGLLDEIKSKGVDPEDIGILVPYVRGANTDVNTTLAIAIVAMVAVQIWGFRSLGFRTYGGKFINVRNGPIFFFVGILEIISEIARLVSFTFRLFGNMFAGEVLLVAMAFLFPLIGTIPFIGLELFVGIIQAFIFAMLTLVFGVMATVGHGEEEH